MLNREKLKVISSKGRNEPRVPTLFTVLNMVVMVYLQQKIIRKEIKGTEIGNGDVKLCISKEDMNLYVKDPKNSVTKLGPDNHFQQMSTKQNENMLISSFPIYP